MMKIRNVTIEDLPKLVGIEQQCFSREEAATEEAFEGRIRRIPDSFFVAEENGEVIGLVNGPVIQTEFITDDLFANIQENPLTGGHQSILGLAVFPSKQSRGVASDLLTHLEKSSRERKRETITLTCKEDLIQFYEKFGFVNRGVSNSEHGGIVWYNMCKKL